MVQLAISDGRYASELQNLLERGGTAGVCCVEVPDPDQDGVIVVDPDGLDRLPCPLLKPERVVLITRNDSSHLMQAWNAGIRSVVFNEDPLATAVLAVMAAGLRVPQEVPSCPATPARTSGCGEHGVGRCHASRSKREGQK